MASNNKPSLAAALGKFSKMLIKEKIIDTDKDESTVIEAISCATHHISQQSISRSSKSPIKSSEEFVKGPLAMIMAKHEKTQNKLEGLRKQKYIEEVSELKSKPTINKDSKNLAKHMPPLHLRTEKILKEKGKKLESQLSSRKQKEDSDFSANCTFKPQSRKSSRSRSPDILTKELYKWDENKKKTLDQKRKQKEKEEILLEKPKIDNLSSRLSKTRCITPVHERLSKLAIKQVTKEEFSFKPQIVPKSRILAGKNSSSKGNTPVSSRASSRASCRSRDSSGSASKRGYRINTCLGVIDKHKSFVNCLQVNDNNRDFLNRLNNLRKNCK